MTQGRNTPPSRRGSGSGSSGAGGGNSSRNTGGSGSAGGSSTRREERERRARQEQAPRFEARRIREAGRARSEDAGGTPRETGTNAAVNARANERRQERERERRMRRYRNIAIGVAIVAAVIIAVVLTLNAPADAPIPDTARTRYEGISQTRDQEGFPRLGEPNARVQVDFFGAYDSTDAKALYEAIMPGMIERIQRRDINLTFVPVPGTNQVANGQGAARAAMCAHEQNRFWPFTDALYNWQGAFPANQAFTQNRILTGVAELGLNRGTFDTCVRFGNVDEVINRGEAAIDGLQGYTAPPAVAINGVIPLDDENIPVAGAEALLAKIDERVIALNTRAESTAEATAEATREAESTAEATPEVNAVIGGDATEIAATPEAAVTPDTTLTAATDEATAQAAEAATPEAIAAP